MLLMHYGGKDLRGSEPLQAKPESFKGQLTQCIDFPPYVQGVICML